MVDVIAVVGTCAPERLRYAKRLAALMGHSFVPASRLGIAPDPVDEAAALLPWLNGSAGVVMEFPIEAEATHVVGTLAEEGSGGRLSEVVCVVDVVHLLTDLRRDDYVTRRVGPLGALRTEHSSRALLTATQMEYASVIVLVGWGALDTATLSTVMAVICHLNPRARLRLHRGAIERLGVSVAPYSAGQDRPGWVSVLNGDFDPHMTDPRVSAYRYEQVRPLHPERLMRLLDEEIGRDAFGTVIRSAGFCRLATRPYATAQWEQVGPVISFFPLTIDDRLDGDDELLSVGQDLAFIGLDLDHRALAAALDRVALTDAELADGPTAWRAFTDPLPRWELGAHRPD